MNADKSVMKYFPKLLTEKQTLEFILLHQKQYTEKGYCYFAVDLIDSGKFIGFIGLGFHSYKSKYTPAIDIGWRLNKNAWGNGYATEGAKKCLEYAFEQLNIDRIISICPEINRNSENVMKKIGMKKLGDFYHPKLKGYPDIEKCVCYEISNEM